MGGFLLIKRSLPKEDLLKIFEQKKQRIYRSISFDDYDLITFTKRSFNNSNLFCFNDGFAALTGTLFYKGLTGKHAAEKLYDDFQENIPIDFTNFRGHYCVIIKSRERVMLFNDYNGIYRVYHDADYNIFSNSFLAVSRFTRNKKLSTQGLYEYLFYGGFFGGETISENVRSLDRGKIIQLYPSFSLTDKQINFNYSDNHYSFNEWQELVLQNIRNQFREIANNHVSISLGLSGGYDSRLILALLVENNIKPFIYTHGSPASREVIISESICRKYNLEFRNYHETNVYAEKDELNNILKKKFLQDDGFNLFGIFYSLSSNDIFTSEKRELNLNGMGGEIYRNRMLLPDKKMSLDYFIKARYLNDFINGMPTDKFIKALFFKNFSDKIRTAINLKDSELTPALINLILPGFRLRYRSGITSSKMNQFCYSILPFAEPSLYLQSIYLPVNFKTAGKFQCALIKNINPELAGIQTNYPYNFCDGAGFKTRAIEMIKTRSPLFLRRLSPEFLKNIFRTKIENPESRLWITKERGELIFNKELAISEYINMDKIPTQDMYSRALTVEYFLRKW